MKTMRFIFSAFNGMNIALDVAGSDVDAKRRRCLTWIFSNELGGNHEERIETIIERPGSGSLFRGESRVGRCAFYRHG